MASSIVAVPEIDSDRFQDFPYDILYNIFLYCTGHKTIASLQRTCRRCYQIGSEEDYLWRNQVAAFYPSLLSIDPYFVGYYFKLRNFATSKKLAALTNLVNTISGSISKDNALKIDASMETLLLCSELNLSKGVCLGPTAGLFFRQLDVRHSFVMLDTLNLSGQHLRAEGLEYLAAAASHKQLPHLKTLSLRENKLGAGVVNEQKRAGEALALLLNQCQGSIASLDLSDNNIVGKSGLEKLLLNSSVLSCVTSAKKILCLPSRITLSRNHLGVHGVAFLLKTFADLILKGENRNNVVNPSCPELLPLAIGCQNVGLGFNFESFADNSGKNIREGAPKATMDELLEMLEQVFHYDAALMSRGCKIGATRLEAKQAKGLAEARKKLDRFNTSSNNDNDDDSTSNANAAGKVMMKQKILTSLSAITRTKQIMFESILILSDSSSAATNSNTDSSSTAAALTASLVNDLPSNLLETVAKKKLDVATFLQISSSTSSNENNNNKKKGGIAAKDNNKPKAVSSDGIAKLSFLWPSFDAAESGSSCVIC